VGSGSDGGELSGEMNGGAPSARSGAIGRPPELQSHESHDMTAWVQTLKRRRGNNDSYPRQKTQRGTAPRWLAAAASLLQAQATASSGSSAPPTSRNSPTSSSWPPLASRLVQWLQSAMNSSNLVAARVQRVSSFADKKPSYGVRYL
jgi:hypothetical protein